MEVSTLPQALGTAMCVIQNGLRGYWVHTRRLAQALLTRLYCIPASCLAARKLLQWSPCSQTLHLAWQDEQGLVQQVFDKAARPDGVRGVMQSEGHLLSVLEVAGLELYVK
eukprot:3905579-Amphidinium_carterae.1